MSVASEDQQLRYDPSFETVLREGDDDSSVPPPPPPLFPSLRDLRGSIFRPKNKVTNRDEETGGPPVDIIPSKDQCNSTVEVDAAEQWVKSFGLLVALKARRRRMLMSIAFLAFVALIIGLAVGLSSPKDDKTSGSKNMLAEAPVSPSTPAPTIAPLPVAAPTAAPTVAAVAPCVDELSTSNTCYAPKTTIDVIFESCEPAVKDWIGIWPVDAASDPTRLPEPSLWLWTCGSQNCDGLAENQTLMFDDGLGRGTYVAHMIRFGEDAAPYTSSYAVSDSFEVSRTCN